MSDILDKRVRQLIDMRDLPAEKELIHKPRPNIRELVWRPRSVTPLHIVNALGQPVKFEGKVTTDE